MKLAPKNHHAQKRQIGVKRRRFMYPFQLCQASKTERLAAAKLGGAFFKFAIAMITTL